MRRLSIRFPAQCLEFKHPAHNQSDRLAERLEWPRPDTGGFRSRPNLWNVRASAGAAVVASMREESECDLLHIVEEVRGIGCSAEVPSKRRSERRQHCLRGMKPQGPGLFRRVLTR